MDGDEEPTEMTAMTSASSWVNTEGPRASDFTAADDSQTSWSHSTAALREYIKSPKGLGIVIVVVMVIVVFLVLMLAKVVAGALHIGECSLDPFVPIYLVCSGLLFLVFMVSLLLVCVKCRHQGESEGDDRVSPLHLLVLFYFFIHLVVQLAGSVCVIRARQDLKDLQSLDLSAPVTESSVVLAQRTVKLVSPEVTPPYPLMESVLRIAPVVTRPAQDLPECSSQLLDFAFGAVIFELVVSTLFFIFILASLYELASIVRSERSGGLKKKIVISNQRHSLSSA